MIRRLLLLVPFLLLITGFLAAQTDPWTGVWRCSSPVPGQRIPITLELQIGKPEQGLLYPAIITLQSGVFTGRYELLLALKSENQLGIGRSKYPLQQTPFQLGIWTWYLNGTLNRQGQNIEVQRLWIEKADLWMRGLYDDDEIYVMSKVNLRHFLYHSKINLAKAGNKPFPDSSRNRILNITNNKIYFGIYHPVTSTNPEIQFNIGDNERYDRDTVTLIHNGRAVFTRQEITDQNREQRIRLDSGRNLFILFADNYGNIQPNTGELLATIDGKPHLYSFSDRSNAYATFLVADIRHQPKAPISTITDTTAIRSTSRLATFKVSNADLILELRDTEIQDGDSISLKLNGQFIAKGFAVKKAIQQIKVKLQKGENRLVFIADNLGSIPPNTAELKIRAGQETKQLILNTDLSKSNEIIFILE